MENNLHPSKKYAKSDLEALEGASNGLTKGQLQAINDAQKAGQSFAQMPANKDNSHMINEHEKFLFHVNVKIPQFDQTTGEDQSESRTDKFNPAMFEACKKSGVFEGRIVTILHDPTKIISVDENGKFAKKKIANIL